MEFEGGSVDAAAATARNKQDAISSANGMEAARNNIEQESSERTHHAVCERQRRHFQQPTSSSDGSGSDGVERSSSAVNATHFAHASLLSPRPLLLLLLALPLLNSHKHTQSFHSLGSASAHVRSTASGFALALSSSPNRLQHSSDWAARRRNSRPVSLVVVVAAATADEIAASANWGC